MSPLHSPSSTEVLPAATGIRVRGLTRRFGPKLALAPTELDVAPGSITGLIGPNGSGKSTLMRCLTGLVPRDAGTATVDGVELRGDGTEVRRHCTYSPGELAVYGELRASAHIEWFLRGRGRAVVRRARELAERFGLPLGARVRTYSHGMKRQLYFVCAIAPPVRVRVLDEITEGLDPSKRGEVLEALRKDAERGCAILLSSHHLGGVERVCDRLVFMSEGRKLSEEDSSVLLQRARRILKLAFETEESARAFAEAAHLDGTIERAPSQVRLTVDVGEGDPRAILARLLADERLPAPLSARFGELSLEELYAELYGVEAC